MEENDNRMGKTKSYQESRQNGGGSGIVIFLAILSLLLALGGALILRQLLSARYDAQVTSIEIHSLSDEKRQLLQQLDELEARYAELSIKHTELEESFAAERNRVNQLRAQLRGDTGATGAMPNIAEYRQRIQELEEQLESYRLQVESMEEEKEVLSSENAQIRSSLAQTTARNQQLENLNQEMEGKLEKATILTISNLEATALRERRRGDEVTDRARRTDKIRICFTINQNLVADPGNRDYFIRIVDPTNQVLTISPDETLEFEGETIQYSLKRTINYQNNAQEVCVMWNQDAKFPKGYYNVVLFAESEEVGYKLFQLN